MAKKYEKREDPPPETALELVGKELGVNVRNMRTGKLTDISLQEISWRPRAALFIANYGEVVLEKIILNEGEATKDRIKALELLMAYTYGKPAQKVEHTGAGGGPIQVMAGRLSGMELDDIQLILNFKPGQNQNDDYSYPTSYGDEVIDIEPEEDYE